MVAAPPTDVAPLASLIDHLGRASTTPTGTVPEAGRVARWVFLVVLLSLLAEWASRRLRGVK
jgi:hypothetical protein